MAGNHLFAVNAGSNTVSMFAINPQNPSQLALVGKPAAVPGEFTNTVAASAKNAMVCVGATGAAAGISCANFDAQTGIGKMDQLREFELKQSTPPVGPTNTVSQVFWSNDESVLFATVKGDPDKNNTGFLSAFPTQKSMSATALSRQDVRSSPKGTAVLFGSLPIPKTSNIFATDASFGGAILSVGANGQGSLVAAQPIDGQKATCWVTISPVRNTAFVTDVGVPKLVEMSLKDASIVQTVDLSSTGATGMIDLKAVGNFVYVLAPGDGKTNTQILVMNAGGGGQKAEAIQRFDAGALGAGAVSQGMVVMD
ncbi:3-carboxymuconate cyclase [Hirsutella rhossiliensis]|uniref:3-carboxymuconate cyclase n=1 Tax=Hirsutella rhossiliensis TaxID=111463 RepID=A0A9P8SIN0_9HYPO|nr:3-carboxymuconate cyclase [Hirsutella rhossiliensis]KAH0962795.1 3-carboxymuconate cyclase [Hirsutella rhossiliensis]